MLTVELTLALFNDETLRTIEAEIDHAESPSTADVQAHP